MNEPANHTAWIDHFGDTWVRADDMPGRYGTWWPLTDGPGWEQWARDGIGQARAWGEVEEYGPFAPADPERTAQALNRVRQEWQR
jgi:hypothetical protein